ncbi:MAG: hypothetical protein WCT29_02130 [Candidatus Paceibacterota bacterium]
MYHLTGPASFETYNSYPFLFSAVSGFGLLLGIDAFTAFFCSVIFFESYKHVTPKTFSSKWFVFIPNLIYLILTFIFIRMEGSGEAAGWGIIGLIFTLPLAILFPMVWIFFSEKSEIKVQSVEKANEPANTQHQIHWWWLVVVLASFIAVLVWQEISINRAVNQSQQYDADAVKRFQEEQNKIDLYESQPPSPNPIFDNAIKKARYALAEHLDVHESADDISIKSYTLKSPEEWMYFQFCKEFSLGYVLFQNFPSGQKISTEGNSKVLSSRQIILTAENKLPALISVPVHIASPVPTTLSFDYQWSGNERTELDILVNGNRVNWAYLLTPSLGSKGFARGIYLANQFYETKPGWNTFTFKLSPYVNGTATISNVELVDDGLIPGCTTSRSEYRQVVYTYNNIDYYYLFDSTGNYFRMGDYR